MDQNDPSIDRLSTLPDDILCLILSFLPTKLSISTSILARGWRFLWAHVPNLHFDSEDHHSRMIFFSIIDRVALLHKMQSPTAFCFCYDDFDSSEYGIEEWIITAIERSVKNIHLDLFTVEYDVDEDLPHLLSGCPVLEELKMSGIMERDRGSCYITSPKIRRLMIEFPHDDTEDYNPYSRVQIDAPALKYLEILDVPTIVSLFLSHWQH